MNELVSASIDQEDACHARMEVERKKRPLSGPTGGALPQYRLVYTSPSGQPCAPLLHLSSRATVHLSMSLHVFQSIHSRLLHLELCSLLEWASYTSTAGVLATSLENVPSLVRATLLEPHYRLAASRRR
jgi:hypothetical protein